MKAESIFALAAGLATGFVAGMVLSREEKLAAGLKGAADQACDKVAEACDLAADMIDRIVDRTEEVVAEAADSSVE